VPQPWRANAVIGGSFTSFRQDAHAPASAPSSPSRVGLSDERALAACFSSNLKGLIEMEFVVTVYADETQDQAAARTLGAIAKRKELGGYINGTFIFKGRQCVDQPDRASFTFLSGAGSANAARSQAAEDLNRDRVEILRHRAVREARDASDLDRLLVLYGVA
jgi:hypothetical protein